MFGEMNKKNTVREGISTKDMEFKPLKDFVGKEIPVDGFFFTEGKFGRQVVVVGCGYCINLPGWAVRTFEEIKADKEKLDAVLAGKLKLNEIKRIQTKNGYTTSFELADA